MMHDEEGMRRGAPTTFPLGGGGIYLYTPRFMWTASYLKFLLNTVLFLVSFFRARRSPPSFNLLLFLQRESLYLKLPRCCSSIPSLFAAVAIFPCLCDPLVSRGTDFPAGIFWVRDNVVGFQAFQPLVSPRSRARCRFRPRKSLLRVPDVSHESRRGQVAR